MDRPEPLAVTECPECLRLRSELDAALSRIGKLETRIQEFHDQLHRNSSKSSTPASANPLNAPKPLAKTPTGKKRGGQPWHRRRRLPAERVDKVVETLRLQGRGVLEFLERSLVAHRIGTSPPALIVPLTD